MWPRRQRCGQCMQSLLSRWRTCTKIGFVSIVRGDDSGFVHDEVRPMADCRDVCRLRAQCIFGVKG